MARYAASGKALATAANSNIVSLRAGSQDRARILEFHLYAEAATAFAAPALFLTTVVDTAGTAVTAQPEDPADGTATSVVSTIPTGGTLAAVAVRRATIPGVIGSGVMWGWPESAPLVVPRGLSLMLRNDGAVGPAVTWVIVWDE